MIVWRSAGRPPPLTLVGLSNGSTHTLLQQHTRDAGLVCERGRPAGQLDATQPPRHDGWMDAAARGQIHSLGRLIMPNDGARCVCVCERANWRQRPPTICCRLSNEFNWSDAFSRALALMQSAPMAHTTHSHSHSHPTGQCAACVVWPHFDAALIGIHDFAHSHYLWLLLHVKATIMLVAL